MIGETISHYKILEKIGEGGMGVVYKAQDTKLDRLVAIKFLPEHFSLKEDQKRRFIHEAKAAAALDHNNICSVHDFGETDDGQMYMVMPCYQGQNLKDKIASRPSPINEAIDTVIQIAEGLNKAHKKNIVHRDIKSANIFITDEGVAKILDFGVAKLKGRTKLTKEDSTLGTIDYMSPEQAEGSKVDHRSDIWSLGVVLYEMITGQLPFRGDYEHAIVYSIMNEQPEPITGLRSGVPLDLENVIDKSLAKEPSERYQGIPDLLVDLKKTQRDLQPGVTPPKKKTSPEITIRTSRKLIGLVGLLFLVIFIIAGYFIFKGKPEPELTPIKPGDKPSLAVLYFENNSGDESLDNWRSALAELITTDLAQSRYIRVLRSDEILRIFKKLNLQETKKYSLDEIKQVAERGRANRILKGSYVKAGENFMLTAMLINPETGETLSSLSVKAEGENNLFPMVDELTQKVKLSLNISKKNISIDTDKKITQITTAYPEAYLKASQGNQYFFRGEINNAISVYKQALEIDPKFAYVYYALGNAYSHIGNLSKSKKFHDKAMKLGKDLPIWERCIIGMAFYLHQGEKQWKKREELGKKLLDLYPTDFLGNLWMADLYTDLEEFDLATKYLNVLIENEVETFWSHYLLSRCFQANGWYAKAGNLIKECLNDFGDNYYFQAFLTGNYIFQRKFDLALSEIDKMSASLEKENHPLLNPLQMRGDIFLYKGELNNAEKNYREILSGDNPHHHLIAHISIAALYTLQGRVEEARNKLNGAIEQTNSTEKNNFIQLMALLNLGRANMLKGELNQSLKQLQKALIVSIESIEMIHWNFQTFARHHLGLIYLKMKSLENVKKQTAEIKDLIDNGMNRKRIRYYYHLKGKMAYEAGDFPVALQYFKKAISQLPHENDYSSWLPSPFFQDQAIFFNSLAQAQYQAGNLDEAQKAYERIISLTVGRIHFGTVYSRAFYHLGEIFQKKGWEGKAIESYNKFIELWKNCDPEFKHLVREAQKRVKELARVQ